MMTLWERSVALRLSVGASVLLVLVAGCGRSTDARHPVGVRDDPFPLLLCWSLEPDGSPYLTAIRADGSARRRVPGSEGAAGGMWHPSGRSIVFLREEGLYLYRLGAPAPVPLDTNGRVIGRLAGFADGSKVVFSWGRRHPTEWYFATDGVSILDTESGAVDDLLVRESVITAAAVSRDGAYVAFGDDTRALAVIDLAKHRMTRELVALDGRHRVAGISWSPDGRFVAFVPHGILFDLQPSSIWVYDTLERSSERLFEGSRECDVGTLVWHPTGSRLAFTWIEIESERPKKTHLCMARPTGSTWSVSEVLAVDGLLTLGGWSHDSQSFAYSMTRGSSSHIYVCAADLSEARAISPPEARDYVPAWQPKRQLGGVP